MTPALTPSALSAGIDRALALPVPKAGGSAGVLDLGIKAGPESMIGYLEMVHRFKAERVNLAGFAQAWAGVTRTELGWDRDFGAMAGLRVSW